jgi:DNA invertase Pin-like site-specific DNA recombinase
MRTCENRRVKIIGYARVSTDAQELGAQRDALTSAGCTEIHSDVVSGATTSRDGLDAAIALLEHGDSFVVTRLDRLGRSMPHLVSTVHELAARGVSFRSLAEAIDTGSAAGRLVLHIFAALADFERELIRERTRAALAAKRRRGEQLGRRRALTPTQVDAAREMLASGNSPSHVARVLRVGRSTIYRSVSAS